MKSEDKQKVRKLYEEAADLTVAMVEAEARRILKNNKGLYEFVCAMGSMFFTTNDGKMLDTHERAYMKQLDDFVNEWNPVFGITGCPMRFTADGPKITNW